MNNYERIKQMSVDEMAEFIDELGDECPCSFCQFHTSNNPQQNLEFKCFVDCVKGVKLWLQKECE